MSHASDYLFKCARIVKAAGLKVSKLTPVVVSCGPRGTFPPISASAISASCIGPAIDRMRIPEAVAAALGGLAHGVCLLGGGRGSFPTTP